MASLNFEAMAAKLDDANSGMGLWCRILKGWN